MTALPALFEPALIPPGPSYAELPAAFDHLKTLRQWCCWGYRVRDGKMTKPPLNPHTGGFGSAADPARWSSYEQAVARAKMQDNIEGVGFTFSGTDNLTGIDLDKCRDPTTGEIDPWAQEIVGLAETYAEVSPSGTGIHLLMEGKLDAAIKCDPANVEIYAKGRYFTVTGDHIRGTPLKIGPAPLTVAALKSRVEQWRAQIEEAKPTAPKPVPAPSRGSTFFRSVNDAALRDLSGWVPFLFPSAKFQPGTGAYRISSRTLGRKLEEDLSIAPNGIVDFGIADQGDGRAGKRTPIDIATEFGVGTSDPVKAAFWLCQRLGREPAYFGWKDETSQREVTRSAIVIGEDVVDGETGEVLSGASPAPGAFLEQLALGRKVDWTHPNGLLSDMTEWILRSSRRPNRPLAVAAAVAALSGVCGRHLYGPTGTALNLYIVGLGGTATGKNRPYSAVGEILAAAKLSKLHTTIKGFSVSAIERLVTDNPCCVATADEIGGNVLAKMSHKNSNTHELGMRVALMELWSREQGMGPYMTHGRATAAAVQVPNPSLSIFGMSTPEAFYDSITSGSVKDGFLNRFLLAQASPRAKPQDVSEEARVVPAPIIDRFVAIVPDAPAGNFVQAVGIFHVAAEVKGVRLGWDHPETRIAAEEFEEAILCLMDAHPEASTLMGRIFEYTVRLASLHAVSREGRGALVTFPDLEWGASWAIQSAKAMIDGAVSLMASNDYEERFNKVQNIIREAKLIGKRELLRKVKSMSVRERDDIIKHLIEGGYIEARKIETKGRHADGYVWIG